jgi:hypothetical protein
MFFVDEDENVERCGRSMFNQLNIPEVPNGRVSLLLILRLALRILHFRDTQISTGYLQHRGINSDGFCTSLFFNSIPPEGVIEALCTYNGDDRVFNLERGIQIRESVSIKKCRVLRRSSICDFQHGFGEMIRYWTTVQLVL